MAIGHQSFYQTALTSAINSTDLIIPLDTVPTVSEGFLVIESTVEAKREIIYFTSKDATTVTVPSGAGNGRGYDGTTAVSHTQGAAVIMAPVGAMFDKLGDVTANSVTVKGVDIETMRTETMFDHVASGGVWSGDSYASTLNASMTALVCYINGRRGTISAVTARAFTASKDTYIDVLNSSGTFSLVYQEVTNNAASPALAANSIRIGIIVTGAGNIAAVGSVNQGQENKVLPIASSIPYTVTDSLGNLICPRDPNRKLLGYRQNVSGFTTTSSTVVVVTGLSVPCIVPAGRKVRVAVHVGQLFNTTSTARAELELWDSASAGVVTGTRLGSAYGVGNNSFSAGSGEAKALITVPTATTKFFNAGLLANNAGTATIQAASTNPVFIMVELA